MPVCKTYCRNCDKALEFSVGAQPATFTGRCEGCGLSFIAKIGDSAIWDLYQAAIKPGECNSYNWQVMC